MDTDAQKTKFFKLLRQFLNNLEQHFPNSKRQISDFRKLMNNTKKNKFIKYVINKLEPYSQDISHNNLEIFNSEKPVYLLKFIDFRRFFEDNVEEETKNSIIQYLQSIYIMGNFILQGSNILNGLKNLENSLNSNETEENNDKAEESINVLKNMFETLQKSQENQSDNTNTNNDNTDTNNDNTDSNNQNTNNKENSNDKKSDNPFGFIEELATEIATEIEIPDELKKDDVKPADLFHSIFFSKDNHFTKMVSKVGEKIHQKMESGELNQEKLFSQTQDIMQNMQKGLGEMQNNPEMMKQMGGMGNILQSMMGGMAGKGGKGPDMGNMMNMFSSMMGGNNGDDDEEMPDLSELQEKWKKSRNQEYRASMRKEQLRKKLENKRKLLENKARFEEKQKQKQKNNQEDKE